MWSNKHQRVRKSREESVASGSAAAEEESEMNADSFESGLDSTLRGTD